MKHFDRWVDPRVAAVRVADACRYLKGRGWVARPFPRPELLVFEGPPADDGTPLVQVLPSDEGADEYPQRVAELIDALAVIEDRTAAAVLADMLPRNGRSAHRA